MSGWKPIEEFDGRCQELLLSSKDGGVYLGKYDSEAEVFFDSEGWVIGSLQDVDYFMDISDRPRKSS